MEAGGRATQEAKAGGRVGVKSLQVILISRLPEFPPPPHPLLPGEGDINYEKGINQFFFDQATGT